MAASVFGHPFFQSKTVIIPADDKRHRGGEDSADSTETALVVADGVGGWALHGVNPGLFSASLTSHAVDLHEAYPMMEPIDIVTMACDMAEKDYEGSATIVALTLTGDFRIKAANLGDSGYALFHVLPHDRLQMYFRSQSQQKTHNFPYQCGTFGDHGSEAEEYVHEDIQDGDVVLVFSDGFHDNVYDESFVYCIEEFLYGGLVRSLSSAADCLARQAYFLGKDLDYLSPWMKEYQYYVEHAIPVASEPPEDYEFIGGKHDDITVTVAQVF